MTLFFIKPYRVCQTEIIWKSLIFAGAGNYGATTQWVKYYSEIGFFEMSYVFKKIVDVVKLLWGYFFERELAHLNF